MFLALEVESCRGKGFNQRGLELLYGSSTYQIAEPGEGNEM